MPTFFSTVLLFFTPFYLACVRKVSGGLFAANSSKLIVIFHFLPVIFGVVGIGFYNSELWMGLETYLTNDMRIFVAVQSIIAINFMLFFIWTFRNKFKLLDQFIPIKTKILPWYIVPKLPYMIFCFTLFLYSFELLRLPAIPIYETIVNGPIAGAIARGLVIDFQIANGIPGFGYILYFFPIISLTWLYTQYLDRKIKFMFWLYTALYFGFNVIFLSKSAFIPAFIMLMWVRYSKKNIIFDYKIIISAILVVAFMFSLLAYQSLGDLTDQIIRRAFFGQVEGMFLIREFYTAPDIAALLYGIPGKDLLGLYTFDPSVEIINKVLGDNDSLEGFVNMNSFYIGQGYVMVGNLILILGPLAYAFNIWLIFKLRIFFPRCNKIGVMNIIQFFFILTLSINTNFALLLFFRPILGFLILSIFFELMCILSQTYKRKSLSEENFPIVPQT